MDARRNLQHVARLLRTGATPEVLVAEGQDFRQILHHSPRGGSSPHNSSSPFQ